MRISDGSSDVCSSDLGPARKTSPRLFWIAPAASRGGRGQESLGQSARPERHGDLAGSDKNGKKQGDGNGPIIIKKYANRRLYNTATSSYVTLDHLCQMVQSDVEFVVFDAKSGDRSEEHTYELQSLMR